MSKNVRFYIDLPPSDAAILVKLTARLTEKTGVTHNRADVMRHGLRQLAKKEKLA